MRKLIIEEQLNKLKTANSILEIDKILDEIVPFLKAAGITLPELMMYVKMNSSEYETRSQDHRETISNSNKAQLVLDRLRKKMNNK
ncbi:hypothetical protein GQR60_07405 [Labilibaculum sp. A4]|uniref:hypothetical protein n=1 Tax=Labilibaculum euxinus TaxID=2686357 RepID=UPI000F6210C7|nr:hypothetical protein [Labilibaculum euxinus]MDQ1769602.1 hypothetical protein [Labilibaculum euxinus]MWN76159.1 hypothetical protein [Labilibaculum euxinus]